MSSPIYSFKRRSPLSSPIYRIKCINLNDSVDEIEEETYEHSPDLAQPFIDHEDEEELNIDDILSFSEEEEEEKKVLTQEVIEEDTEDALDDEEVHSNIELNTSVQDFLKQGSFRFDQCMIMDHIDLLEKKLEDKACYDDKVEDALFKLYANYRTKRKIDIIVDKRECKRQCKSY